MVSYRLFQLEFDPVLGRYVRRLVGEYNDEWTARNELRARRQAATTGQPTYELHPHELEVRHFPRSRSSRGGGPTERGGGKPGASSSTRGASVEGERSSVAESPPSQPQKPQLSSDGS